MVIERVSTRLVREATFEYNNPMQTPEAAVTLIKHVIGDKPQENFVVVCLDTKGVPTRIEIVHVGTLNQSLIHPANVFRLPIISNASSIIIGHNHPSGNPTPSKQDIRITKALIEAGTIMQITVLDHVIIGNDCYFSFKEKGVI